MTKTRLKTLLLGAALFCAATSSAQVPLAPLDAKRLAAIDGFIHHEMVRQRIPGLELGIYSRGRVLLAKGYGVANVELRVRVKPDTLMQSGSVGKQFVSAAIMMLVEEGKIALDDSITKTFPDAPAAWKPILIKNLLSHTSGLAEYESPDRTGPNGPFYFRLDFTEDELAKKVEALPIESAPGEKWDYRNTNYLLLGILIHKVTGVPYAEFLRERIFKPLGMTATRPISDRDVIPNRAAGYEIDRNDELKNQEWVSPTFNSTADGTLYLNVVDMAKWDEALYGTKLLTHSSLDRIWTIYPLNDGKPNPAGYGFGWLIGAQNGHKLIEHGGSWQGFTCRISRYPDDGLTVVVLTNLEAGYSNPGEIAHVAAGLVNAALTVPKLTKILDDRPAIALRLRKVLDAVVAGADIRSELAPQVAAGITPDVVKDMQHSLGKLWPGGTLTLVRRRDQAPDRAPERVSWYRLRKGNDALLLVLGVNAHGKISTFRRLPDREYQ